MPQWSDEQLARMERFGVQRSVDIHCHCLPNLDDGPQGLEEAVALCQALVADGVTNVIATPHQLGSYDRRNSATVVRQAVGELAEELEKREIPLEIETGGDVRLDDRLLRLMDTGEVQTVANAGTHLLLELPHEQFIDPLPLIKLLADRNVQTIMTHPERHRYLQGSTSVARAWIEAGAVVQVTSGSLLGNFGPHAYDHAWRLATSGLIGLVSSDAHDARRRPPCMTAALSALIEGVGEATARRICLENPLRVWEGSWI